MKTLLLMRHAKSDWSNNCTDFERPLNARGRSDAPKMGHELLRQGLLPDHAVVSGAKRTRETWRYMEEVFSWNEQNVPVQFSDQLYLAGLGSIQASLPSLMLENVHTLLMIGHNPGWSDTVYRLSGHNLDLSTANIAILEHSMDTWNNLFESTSWTLVQVLKPRTLL